MRPTDRLRRFLIDWHAGIAEGSEPQMTLAELLEGKFRGDIRFRGQAYVKAERVEVTRVTADHLFAVVRDGVDYETQLSRDNDQLRLYCTCSSGAQQDVTCKHVWATILTVDEGRLLSSSARPGFVPQFVVETSAIKFDEEEFDDEFLMDYSQPTVARQSTATKVRVEPVLKPWESRLQDLKKDMETSDASPGKNSRERQIYYEVDLAQSRENNQLVIQTSQRQRRANGQWGKLKPLKLRPGKLDEIEHVDDRRILAYLYGGMPERNSWYAQQAESQASVYRYRVPFELCELILPMICQTGRLRYHEDDGAGECLEWDDSEAWELSMEVAAADEGWTLSGALLRGEERLDLRDCRLLVPGGLVLTDTQISRVRDYGASAWLPVLQEDVVQVDAGEEHELVDRLLDMPVLPRLSLPEELRLEEVECEPGRQLVIRTPKQARWHNDRLQGEVAFDYLGTALPGGSVQWAIVQRDQGRCILRNRNYEDLSWSQLEEHGFRRLLDQRRGKADVEISARDLGSAVRQLIEIGWDVRADGKQVRQPGDVQFRVQSGIDWFELHADVDFGGARVQLPELLSALSRGDTTIRLDDGSLGILPEHWLEQFGMISGLGATEEDHVRFSANQVALLDALLQNQEQVTVDDRFQELRSEFENFTGVELETEGTGFRGELRPYQREGLGWLSFLQKFSFGGCLADDMGLGKTVQMLALLQARKMNSENSDSSLVVVPKSLLFNWHQEAERFAPALRVLEYSGIDRGVHRKDFDKYDLILTTYGTLRRDILIMKDIQFDYVVLDEAQTIKNASSQVAKASRLLQARHRLALSGTPIENHLGDLWSIFEFLNPGMLGRSSTFKQFASDGTDENARRALSMGLRPFILRRTKQQVASELPEKFEQTIHCEMSDDQRRRYDELREHYRQSLLGIVDSEGINKSKMHVLEALLRLRQAACHPGLLDKSYGEESSAKLDYLVPHLKELIEEGHKALVFSQFTTLLALVKDALDEQEIEYEYLDGKTRNRKKRVERFQEDPDCGVFLISLKAGGLGLNLTAADYVFLLDPWWNPAVEAQAIDRAHRVGQERHVFAYRLICRDTVEEKIANLQKKKRDLADAILEREDENILRNLSRDDLELLLS